MDLGQLRTILDATTVVYRKGAAVEERGGALHVYNMPPVEDVPPTQEPVDVHFCVVGVDRAQAEEQRAQVTALLRTYPDPARLAGGPGYIELGGVLGSQEAALRLMALGSVLGLWRIMTPASMGITGPDADELAGNGLVLTTGWRPGTNGA